MDFSPKPRGLAAIGHKDRIEFAPFTSGHRQARPPRHVSWLDVGQPGTYFSV